MPERPYSVKEVKHKVKVSYASDSPDHEFCHYAVCHDDGPVYLVGAQPTDRSRLVFTDPKVAHDLVAALNFGSERNHPCTYHESSSNAAPKV